MCVCGGSFLPTCWSQGLNSGPQAWKRMLSLPSQLIGLLILFDFFLLVYFILLVGVFCRHVCLRRSEEGIGSPGME